MDREDDENRKQGHDEGERLLLRVMALIGAIKF